MDKKIEVTTTNALSDNFFFLTNVYQFFQQNMTRTCIYSFS